MKIVDLTLPMYTGMPVYPGDPEVSIKLIQTLEKDGWNMRRLQINGHDGTHVNAPIHGVKDGKNLDDMELESFCGPAEIYGEGIKMVSTKGIIFRDQNITEVIAKEIIKNNPHFVGLSSKYEIDERIEKNFLRNEIVLFERLTNLDKLPNEFLFYGMPLKIKGGDGSPVRAFAEIN